MSKREEEWENEVKQLGLRIQSLQRELETAKACGKTWRAEYASRIMAGLMTTPGSQNDIGISRNARRAVEAADALIRQLALKDD